MSIEDERKRYRQTFSQIHIPHEIEMNTERKTKMNWFAKHAAALFAAAILMTGSTAAYAADLGGIRTTVSYWLNGEEVETEAISNDDGGYYFPEQGVGGGGISYDRFGNEQPMSAQELAEMTFNEYVEIRDNGEIWLKSRLGLWDITDLFEESSHANITDGKTYFMIDIEEDRTGTSMETTLIPNEGVDYISLQKRERQKPESSFE